MGLIRTHFGSVTATALICFSLLWLASACDKQGGTANAHAESKNLLTLTKKNFKVEVLSSSQPVLVDFWATWCGPCKMIAPSVAELAEEFEGRAKVGKVDVDKESALARQYNISAIPTLLVFKDGKVVDQVVGASSKQELKAVLAKHVQTDPATPPAK